MGQGDFRIHFESDAAAFASNLTEQFGGINRSFEALTSNLRAHASEIDAILGSIGGKKTNVAERLNSALGLDKLGQVGDTISAKLSASIENALVTGIERGVAKMKQVRITIPIEGQVTGTSRGASGGVRLVPAAEESVSQPGKGRPTSLTIPDEAIRAVRDARAAIVEFTQYTRKTRDAAKEASREIELLVGQLHEIKRARPDLGGHLTGGAVAGQAGAVEVASALSQIAHVLQALNGNAGPLKAQTQAVQALAEVERVSRGRVRADVAQSAFAPNANFGDPAFQENYIARRAQALGATLGESLANGVAAAELSIASALRNPQKFFESTGGPPTAKSGQPVPLQDLLDNPNRLISAIKNRLRDTTGNDVYTSGAVGLHSKDTFKQLFEGFGQLGLLAPGLQKFDDMLQVVQSSGRKAAQAVDAQTAATKTQTQTQEQVAPQRSAKDFFLQKGFSEAAAEQLERAGIFQGRPIPGYGAGIGAAGQAERQLRENLFAVQDKARQDVIDLLPPSKPGQPDYRAAAAGLNNQDLLPFVQHLISDPETAIGKSKLGKIAQSAQILKQTFESLERVPENAKKTEALRKSVDDIIKAESLITGHNFRGEGKENVILSPQQQKLQDIYDQRQRDLKNIEELQKSGVRTILPPLAERPIPGGKAAGGSTIGGGRGGPTRDLLDLEDKVRAGANPTVEGFRYARGSQSFTHQDVRAEVARLLDSVQAPQHGENIEALRKRLTQFQSLLSEMDRIERAKHELSPLVGKVVSNPGFLDSSLRGLDFAPRIARVADQVNVEESDRQRKGTRTKFPEQQRDQTLIDTQLQQQGRVEARRLATERSLNAQALSGAFLDLINTSKVYTSKTRDASKQLSNILLPQGFDKLPSVSKLSRNILDYGDPVVHGTALNDAVKGLLTTLKQAQSLVRGGAKDQTPEQIQDRFNNALGSVQKALERIFGAPKEQLSATQQKAQNDARKRAEQLFDKASDNELLRNLATRRTYSAGTLGLDSLLSIPGASFLTESGRGKDRYFGSLGENEQARLASLYGEHAPSDLQNLKSLFNTHSGYFGDLLNIKGTGLLDGLKSLRDVNLARGGGQLTIPGAEKILGHELPAVPIPLSHEYHEQQFLGSARGKVAADLEAKYGTLEKAEQQFVATIDRMVKNLVSKLTDIPLSRLGKDIEPLLGRRDLGTKLLGYDEHGAPKLDASAAQSYLRDYARLDERGAIAGGLDQLSHQELQRYLANVGTTEAAPAAQKVARTKAQNVSSDAAAAAKAGAEAVGESAAAGAKASREAIVNEVRTKKGPTASQKNAQAQARQVLATIGHQDVLKAIDEGRLSDAYLGLREGGFARPRALSTIGDAGLLSREDRAGLRSRTNALGDEQLRVDAAKNFLTGVGPETQAQLQALKGAFDSWAASAGQEVGMVEAKLQALRAALEAVHASLMTAGLGQGKAQAAAAYSLGLTERELAAKLAGGGSGGKGGGGGRKTGTGGGGTSGEEPEPINAQQLENIARLQAHFARSQQDGAAYQRLLLAQERAAQAELMGDYRARIGALGELRTAELEYARVSARGNLERLTSQRQGSVAGRFFRGIGNAANRYTGDLIVFAGAQKLQQEVQEAFQLQREFIRIESALEAVGQSSAGLRTNLRSVASELGQPLKEVYQTASELVGVFQNSRDLTFATRVVEQLKLISDGALSTQEAFRGFASIASAYQTNDQTRNLRRYSDYVTQAQNLTGTNVADIVEGTGRLAPEAKAFNLPLPALVAIVAEATKSSGQSGEAAGEQLSRAFATLQAPNVQQLLLRTGVAAPSDLEEGGLGKIFINLLKKVAAGDIPEGDLAELRHDIGGGRQAAVINSLIGSPQSAQTALKRIEGVTDDSYGAAKTRAEKLIDTFSGQIGRFQANISGLAQVIVNSGLLDLLALLFKEFNDLTGVLVKLLSGFEELVHGLGPLGSIIKTLVIGSVGLKITAAVLSGFFSSFTALRTSTGVVGGILGGRAAAGGAAGAAAAARRAGQLELFEEGAIIGGAGPASSQIGRARAAFAARQAATREAATVAATRRLETVALLSPVNIGGAVAPLAGAVGGLAAVAGPAAIAIAALGIAIEGAKLQSLHKADQALADHLTQGSQATSIEELRAEAADYIGEAKDLRDESSGFFGSIARRLEGGISGFGYRDPLTRAKAGEEYAAELKREADAIQVGLGRSKSGTIFGPNGIDSATDLQKGLQNLSQSGKTAAEVVAELNKALDITAGAAERTASALGPNGSIAVTGGDAQAFANSLFLPSADRDAIVPGSVKIKDYEGVYSAYRTDFAYTLNGKQREALASKIASFTGDKKFLTKEDQATIAQYVADAYINAGILDPTAIENIKNNILRAFQQKATDLRAGKNLGVFKDQATQGQAIDALASANSNNIAAGEARGVNSKGLTKLSVAAVRDLERVIDNLRNADIPIYSEAKQKLAEAKKVAFDAFAQQVNEMLEAEKVGKTEKQQKALDKKAGQLLKIANTIDPTALATSFKSIGQVYNAVTNATLTAATNVQNAATAALRQAEADAAALLAEATRLRAVAAAEFARADATNNSNIEVVAAHHEAEANRLDREAGGKVPAATAANAAKKKPGPKNDASYDVRADSLINNADAPKEKESAAAIAAARAAANADPRDRVAQTAADILKAQADVKDADKGSVAYYNALKAVKEAKIAHLQAEIELANSVSALNVHPGDHYAQAVEKLKEDRRTLRGLKKGTAEYNKQLGQVAQDREDLANEVSRARSVAYRLARDITNPVQEARTALREAKEKLARDLREGASQAQINEDRLNVKEQQANLEQTTFSRNMNIARINYELGKSAATANAAGALSYKQYVAYLEAEQARLLAIKNRTDQQTQELGEVTATLDALKASMQGQFNLGDIRVPTPYEARRFIAEQINASTTAAQAIGAGSATGAAQTLSTKSTTTYNQTNNTTINVNGNDMAAMKTVLSQYIGPSAFGRTGTSSQKV